MRREDLKSAFCLAGIAMLLLAVSPDAPLAQMGHGMMRGGHMMEEGGHMMGGDRDKGDGDMRGEMPGQQSRMMKGMMSATQDIAIMMRQMSVMMADITSIKEKMHAGRMNEMSSLMKDMSSEMNRISDLMRRGSADDEEIRMMQQRVADLQDRLWKMRR